MIRKAAQQAVVSFSAYRPNIAEELRFREQRKEPKPDE
jgi:hypothetical protein